MRCPARSRRRSSPSRSRCTRSTLAGSPARSAWPGGPTPSCRPASSPSRACCPATRPSARSSQRSRKTYGRRGAEVVEKNLAAVDRALERPAPDPGARAGDINPGAAAGRSGRRAGVRPHRHRGDDGRPRRRPAGQHASRRRHLPERHRRLREAQHLRPGRAVGSRPVHPVRQLQLRLPAQRDQVHLLRRVTAGRRAAGVPVGSAGRPRAAGHPVHAPGVRGGLHRLRAVRPGLPGQRARRPGASRRSTSRPASRW